MPQGPLHGVRVLEFGIIVAAPYLAMNLADLGANVIKVEPLEGEPRRNNGTVPGTSRVFQWVNRGKRSVQVDLKSDGGRALIHRMVKDVDVVTVNYRPGVPKRLGIDYETLSWINPRLIYAEITGFGSEGPMAGDGGADVSAQAYSGTMAANGKVDEHGAPESVGGVLLGDASSGLGGAMGVCAALFHRERTGEGQYLETSLVGAAMALAGVTPMRDGETDRVSRANIIQRYAEVRAAGGNYQDLLNARKENTAPRRGSNYWGGYNAADGALALSANTVGGRLKIRQVLGLKGDGTDDPAIDPRESDFPDLVKAEREDMERVLRTRTVNEWMTAFRAVGAPVAPVLLPEEVADDKQGKVYFQDLVHPVTGPEKQVKPIVQFSRTPSFIRGPADMPGQHVDEVLHEFGLSDDEIAALRAEQVLNPSSGATRSE